MKTAVEIYRLLPKTNCGKCGTASCFGFAAKLASRQAKADDCPELAPEAGSALRDPEEPQGETPGTVYDQVLELLRPKVRSLDFRKTAPRFGARLTGQDCMLITFLNEAYTSQRTE